MVEEKPCILSLSAEVQAYSAKSGIEEEYEQIELIDELELSSREEFTLVTSHINGKYNYKLIMQKETAIWRYKKWSWFKVHFFFFNYGDR